MPALAPTWSAHGPLTGRDPWSTLATAWPGTAAGVHDRASRGRTDDRDAPEPGRVVGLVAVRPQVRTAAGGSPSAVAEPADSEPAGAEPTPAAYPVATVPLRHVAARPVLEHPGLTAATDEYVGAPLAPAQAPAPQPTSSLWPDQRRPSAEPPVEAATEAGARFRQALADLRLRGEPDSLPGRRGLPDDAPTPVTPGNPSTSRNPGTSGGAGDPGPAGTDAWGSAPSGRAPAPGASSAAGPDGRSHPAVEHPTVGNDEPTLRHRRLTLAESRRLGLGLPVGSAATDPAADPAGEMRAGTQAQTPVEMQSELPEADTGSTRPADTSDAGGPTRGSLLPQAVRVRLLTDGAPRPDATTTPLVFRGRVPRPSAHAAPILPEQAVVTRPPAELADALRTGHGLEVHDVPVRRDPAAGSEARSRRARAFTRGGTVYLPDDAGPVTDRRARALLAHELVHAAQQRRLGGTLPGEHTTEGQALEAEARAVEARFGGDALPADQPLRHAPSPVSPSWVDDRITQHATELGAPPSPRKLDDDLIYEVRYEAQQVLKDAGGLGGASGSGSGSGGRADGTDGQGGVGIGHATSVEQFQAQMLTAINVERASRRQAPLASIHDLSASEQDMINTRYNEAALAAHQQKVQKDLRAELGLPETPGAGGRAGVPGGRAALAGGAAAAAAAGTMWTPQGGFQTAGGAPVTGSPAGTAAASAAPGGAGRPDDGVGLGHAKDLPEFRRQMLVALSVQAGHDVSWESLSPDSQAMIDNRYAEQAALHRPAELQRAVQERLALGTAGAATSTTGGTTAGTTAGTPATAGTATAATAVAGTAAGTAAAAGADHHGPSAPTDPAVAQARATAGAAHPAAHGPLAADHLDLEELSGRLYDRLRSRLRTELLVDRERAGLLTDFR